MQQFTSPSKGKMSLDQVFADMMAFVDGDPQAAYKIIIGTDSQAHEETCFVTAVVIHQVGKGARFYYQKRYQRKITSLRQKIFFETALSLELAEQVSKRLSHSAHQNLDIEIHLDIGPNGETKELIREIVGMVVGSGYDAKIKPDSCGASKVADKYTK